MIPALLHDRSIIEPFLRRNVFLNLYAIGDLDDFFFPYTTWFASPPHSPLQAIALLYSGTDYPVLLADGEADDPHLIALVESMLPFLPARLYAHLSPGVEAPLSLRYRLHSHGKHIKMALKTPRLIQDGPAVEPLCPGHLEELEEFYRASYPGNWFDPRMLETGCYYGIRQEGALVSVAGVHVYSPRLKVAALGNITTLPGYRGQGLAQAVTAQACRHLLQQVDHIGLNVRADNLPAIRAYQKLGFEKVATYEEFALEYHSCSGEESDGSGVSP